MRVHAKLSLSLCRNTKPEKNQHLELKIIFIWILVVRRFPLVVVAIFVTILSFVHFVEIAERNYTQAYFVSYI